MYHAKKYCVARLATMSLVYNKAKNVRRGKGDLSASEGKGDGMVYLSLQSIGCFCVFYLFVDRFVLFSRFLPGTAASNLHFWSCTLLLLLAYASGSIFFRILCMESL